MAVCEPGGHPIGQRLLLYITAVEDRVEVLDLVEEVEAESLAVAASPGALACPGCSSTLNVEINICLRKNFILANNGSLT